MTTSFAPATHVARPNPRGMRQAFRSTIAILKSIGRRFADLGRDGQLGPDPEVIVGRATGARI